MRKRNLFFSLFVLVMLLGGVASAQSVLYVTQTGAGNMDGSSWENALPDSMIQDAIDIQAAKPTGGQVWVAQGTYYPKRDFVYPNDPKNVNFKTFRIKSKVGFYGGFKGNETTIDQRTRADLNGDLKIHGWEFENKTILSGNTQRDTDSTNNSFHVVTQDEVYGENIVINGFTICDGSANAEFAVNKLGGGVFAQSATINCCAIIHNWCERNGGGGVFIGANSVLDSSLIMGNTSTYYGAGIMANGGIISNCYILNNFAGIISTDQYGEGGGVYMNTPGKIVSCVIANNFSRNRGGGMVAPNGGIVVNSLVINNSARNLSGGYLSNVTFINNTLSNDTTGTLPFVHIADKTNIYNTIFLDRTNIETTKDDQVFSVNSSFRTLANIVGTGLITMSQRNEVFVNAVSFTEATFSKTDEILNANWELSPKSKAFNNGIVDEDWASIVSAYLPPFDVFGRKRINMGSIDIGASELCNRRYVSHATPEEKAAMNPFNEWRFALPSDSLQYALDMGPGEVWVAKGDYSPVGASTHFKIPGFVQLYGGFLGNELSVGERLRSDLNGDSHVDAWEFFNQTVIREKAIDTMAFVIDADPMNPKYIDGVTLQGGNFDIEPGNFDLEFYRGLVVFGGGIELINGNMTNCVVRDFRNRNIYDGYGGISWGSVITFDNPDYFKKMRAAGVTLRKKASIDNSYISGNKSQDIGAGLFMNGESSATSCIVTRNSAGYWAAGAFLFEKPTLKFCRVVNNMAGVDHASESMISVRGAGVLACGISNSSRPVIRDCIISNNSSDTAFNIGYGGGIYVINDANIASTTIIANDANYGDDLYVFNYFSMYNSFVGSNIRWNSLKVNLITIHNSAIVGGFNQPGIDVEGLINIHRDSLKREFEGIFPSKGFQKDGRFERFPWQLSAASKVINKGGFPYPSLEDVDIMGNIRRQYGMQDLGACEKTILPPTEMVELNPIAQRDSSKLIFSWKNPVCQATYLFVKTGSSGNVMLTNGQSYTASSDMKGSFVDGWQCVYHGNDTVFELLNPIPGATYYAQVIPYNGVNYKVYNNSFEVGKNIQSLTVKKFQTVDITLAASLSGTRSIVVPVNASSGNVPKLSTNATWVRIVGTTLSFDSTGTFALKLHVDGNDYYFPYDTTIYRAVDRTADTISIGSPLYLEDTVGNFSLISVVNKSGIPVQYYISNPSVVNIINGYMQYLGAGETKVVAYHKGDKLFYAAHSDTIRVTVHSKMDRLIVGDLSALTSVFVNAPDMLVPVSALSGRPLSFSSSDSSVAIVVGGYLKTYRAGSAVISVSCKEDSRYEAIASKTLFTVEVNKKKQQLVRYQNDTAIGFLSHGFAAAVRSSAYLPLSFESSHPNVLSVVDGWVTPKSVGTAYIKFWQAGNDTYDNTFVDSFRVVVTKANQTITLVSPTDDVEIEYSPNGEIEVQAYASSLLDVRLSSSDESVVGVVGNVLKVRDADTTKAITITLSQPGNQNYEPARDTTFTVKVNRAKQSLTDLIASHTMAYKSPEYLIPIRTTSKLALSYEVADPSVATVVDGYIFTKKADTTTIKVWQKGNKQYLPSDTAIITLIVTKINQTIHYSSDDTIRVVYGQPEFMVDAYADSRLSIAYASSDSSVVVVNDGMVSVKNADTAVVTLSQSGNENYNAARDTSFVIIVAKGQQTLLKRDGRDTLVYGTTDILLTNASSSGLPLEYKSSNDTVATAINGVLSVKAASVKGGTDTYIRFWQPGNGQFEPTKIDSFKLVVLPRKQSISVKETVIKKTYGDFDFPIVVSNASGNPVLMTPLHNNVVSVNNQYVSIKGAGRDTIVVSQPGNRNFLPAENDTVIIVVDSASQTIVDFNKVTSIEYGSPRQFADFRASSRLPLQFVSDSIHIVSVEDGWVTPQGVGTATVRVFQPGDANYKPSDTLTFTVVVTPKNQSIILLTPDTIKATYGDNDYVINAISTVGLSLTYRSSNEQVARVNNGIVTITGKDTATITISQDGNGNFGEAADTTVTIIVEAGVQKLVDFDPADMILPFNAPDTLLAAKSDRGLALNYASSDVSVATVIHGVISVKNAGTTEIMVWHPGNAQYDAIDTVSFKLTVSQVSQQIKLLSDDSVVVNYGDPDFFIDVENPSGMALKYFNKDNNILTVNNGLVTPRNAGKDTVYVWLPENTNYAASNTLMVVVEVKSVKQTLEGTLKQSSYVYGSPDVLLPFRSSKGLPLNYSSSRPDVATVVNGVLSIRSVDTTTITVWQPGNMNVDSIPKSTFTIAVTPASQKITLNTASVLNLVYGEGDAIIGAVSDRGLLLSYKSSDMAVASVNNGVVTPTGKGDATIYITQLGNKNIDTADTVTVLVRVTTGTQKLLDTNSVDTLECGSPEFLLTARSDKGLPLSYLSSNPDAASIVGNSIIAKNAGKTTITLWQNGNDYYQKSDTLTFDLVVVKKPQAILYSGSTSIQKLYGDDKFEISAKSSIDMPLTYKSSDTRVATFINGIVTILGVGSAELYVVQTGNATIDAADTLKIKLVVSKGKPQLVDTNSIRSVVCGSPEFLLTARSSVGLPLSYSSTRPEVVTIVGSSLSFRSAGFTTIRLWQPENAFYLSSDTLSFDVEVSKKSQTIEYQGATTLSKVFSSIPFDLSASSSENLPLTYTSSVPTVATINNGKVTMRNAGTTIITISQPGTSTIAPSNTVTITLTVTKMAQLLENTNSIAEMVVGDAYFELTARASSGLPLTYSSSVPGVATVIDGSLIPLSVGSTTISMVQPGNSQYEPTPAFSFELTVSAKDNRITLLSFADTTVTYGTPEYLVKAYSSLGLPLTYQSSDPAVASVNYGQISFNGAGYAEITITQPGNATTKPAEPATITVTVEKAPQQLKNIDNALTFTHSDSELLLTVMSDRGLQLSYTIENTGVATVMNGVVTPHNAGETTLLAWQAGNNQYHPTDTARIPVVVNKKPQEIIVSENRIEKTYGDVPFQVLASATLPVSFKSLNTNVVTISNTGVVTIRNAGETSIIISQAGNANIDAAISKTVSISVGKATQTIVNNEPRTVKKTYGDASFQLDVQPSGILPLTFTSTNKSVAYTINNEVYILAAGTTDIIVSLPGNDNYDGAQNDTITLEVNKLDHSIQGDSIISLYQDEANIPVRAYSYPGIKFTLSSLDENVFTVNRNDLITAVKPGIGLLKLVQRGSYPNYTTAADKILPVVVSPVISIIRDTSFDLAGMMYPNGAVFSVQNSEHFTVTVKNNIITIHTKTSCWYGTEVLHGYVDGIEGVIGKLPFNIKVTRLLVSEQLEMVTVAPVRSNTNLVVWRKTANAGIKEYIVERGGIFSDEYTPITTVPFFKAGSYRDANVNVDNQSYSYRLITVDSCGNKSLPSRQHTTMLLKSTVGTNGEIVLDWNKYEGVEVSTYTIFKFNETSQEFDSISSTIFDYFVDKPKHGIAKSQYRVGIMLKNAVDTSQLKSDGGPYSYSISNMCEAELTDGKIILGSSVSVYPTIASDVVFVKAPLGASINVVDCIGKVISSFVAQSATSTLNCRLWHKGIYMVSITYDGHKMTKEIEVK